MTELRQSILNSIYKKEEDKVNKKINLHQDNLNTLLMYYKESEERLSLCLKYKIDCELDKLRKIDKLNQEYQNLKMDKKIVDICDISILTFAHLFLFLPSGEFDMAGYSLANFLNLFKINYLVSSGLIYYPKKYKLVKKNLKKEVKVNINTFDELKLKNELKRISTEKGQIISKVETEIEKLYSSLEKLRLQLFKCKMLYNDDRFCPIFNDRVSANCYNFLLYKDNKVRLFSDNKKNVKVKTLKNKVIIK